MKSVTQDGRALRWDAHRKERRRELLRMVRHSVADLGPDASMDQICEATGTSKTVLYRYFGDRAGLVDDMGQWAMKVITQQLDRAATPDMSPREALTHMIAAFVDLASSRPHVYRFCDRGVTHQTGQQTFFDSTAQLLCARMNFTQPEQYMWARGALGFVRACTDEWLTKPTDPHTFATHLSTWLWESAPATDNVEGKHS